MEETCSKLEIIWVKCILTISPCIWIRISKSWWKSWKMLRKLWEFASIMMQLLELLNKQSLITMWRIYIKHSCNFWICIQPLLRNKLMGHGTSWITAIGIQQLLNAIICSVQLRVIKLWKLLFFHRNRKILFSWKSLKLYWKLRL